MSAMVQLKISVEEQSPLDEACSKELRKALELTAQLEKELQDLRICLAENEHLAEQKKLLLASAFAQEQILRTELMRTRPALLADPPRASRWNDNAEPLINSLVTRCFSYVWQRVCPDKLLSDV
jgi:hypothetical protein